MFPVVSLSGHEGLEPLGVCNPTQKASTFNSFLLSPVHAPDREISRLGEYDMRSEYNLN